MYLPWNASRARVREAENARRKRAESLQAWSHGRLSRRDLMKLGLFTAAGTLVSKNGLSPFARSAYADDSSIPTGLPRSPLFGVQAFTQPMLRFDVLPRTPVSALSPAPTAQANTTQQVLNTALEGVRPGDTGPIEGRPPGPIWAHQEFTRFAPAISIQATQEGAKVNTVYNPRRHLGFQLGHQRRSSLTTDLPPEPARPGTSGAVDVQRDVAAQADAGPLRRARPLPPPQPAAVQRHPERRLRTAHDHDPRAQRAPRVRERRFHGGLLLPRPVLRLPLSRRPGGLEDHQSHRYRSPGRRPRRQRWHHQGPRRLARDHEQPLVPRSHVQLHLPERLQGHGRDVQHLQLPRSRQRGPQRRREP